MHRLEAFSHYLESRHPHSPRPVLLQIAPTSRGDVAAYQEIREELERTAGAINAYHSELDWTPVRYVNRHVDREVIAGLYRRAAVALVTPLADGMNLVAKEFVAAQDPADPGVLILSHFAGAAEQMQDALMVNPFDHGSFAAAIDPRPAHAARGTPNAARGAARGRVRAGHRMVDAQLPARAAQRLTARPTSRLPAPVQA